MKLLTADDVLTVKFEVSSFKEGYKQDEVDVFLDDVTTTMREFEERLGTSQESSGPSHRKAEILLTSEGVRNIRFSTTRWSGYRMDQVDAFLAQVLASLEALEAQLRTDLGERRLLRRPARCRSRRGLWRGVRWRNLRYEPGSGGVRPGRRRSRRFSVRRGDRPAGPVHRPAPAGGRLLARRARVRPAPAGDDRVLEVVSAEESETTEQVGHRCRWARSLSIRLREVVRR